MSLNKVLWFAALCLCGILAFGFVQNQESTQPLVVPVLSVEAGPTVDELVGVGVDGVDGLVGSASVFTGKVTKVIDGDTLLVDRRRGGEEKIRMASIDAPESSQQHGQESKAYLEKLVGGKEVQVQNLGTDRYGRIVGTIKLGRTNINKKLVADGSAWFYVGYENGNDYSVEQFKATKDKVGLWRSNGNIPPWLYRRLESLGTFGHNVVATGLYLDASGVLHNSRCTSKATQQNRWNGTDRYSNCTKCGGAIFD